MVILVPASEKDVPRILEIEQEAFSPPWTEESLLDELKRDDSYFIVAVRQGVRQGSVSCLKTGVCVVS